MRLTLLQVSTLPITLSFATCANSNTLSFLTLLTTLTRNRVTGLGRWTTTSNVQNSQYEQKQQNSLCTQGSSLLWIEGKQRPHSHKWRDGLQEVHQLRPPLCHPWFNRHSVIWTTSVALFVVPDARHMLRIVDNVDPDRRLNARNGADSPSEQPHATFLQIRRESCDKPPTSCESKVGKVYLGSFCTYQQACSAHFP